MSDALEFLLSRRSRPGKTLVAPAPSDEDLGTILTAAARTPDHGKLEPWRFVVLRQAALRRIAGQVRARAADLGMEQPEIDKAAQIYETSPLAVMVVSQPKPSPKIPQIEQIYSAGAVCLAMLNTALVMGWGANWLSGWPSHDQDLTRTAFGLGEDEAIAGLIHIGTQTSAPPERPRPDLEAITTWVAS